MKNLSKLAVLSITSAALLLTMNAKAQTTAPDALRMSIGLEAADPTGNVRIGSKFILGGTIRLQYGITNNFAVTLTGGAYHFISKDNPATGRPYDSFGELPFKAGVKEFFLPNIYVGAEAGEEFEITDNGWGPKRFVLSPALGYANTHWDFALHYDNFSGPQDHFGLIGVRLAYAFKL